jgi:hypothetical protein
MYILYDYNIATHDNYQISIRIIKEFNEDLTHLYISKLIDVSLLIYIILRDLEG